MSRSQLPTIIALTLALTPCVLSSACKSEGSFTGEVSEPQQDAGEPPAAEAQASTEPSAEPPTKVEAPPTKYEGVQFTWESKAGGLSGSIQATLPDGEAYSGQYHEVTSTTSVEGIGGFYGDWYGDGWAGPEWGWDDDWGYYDSPDAYITHYSGKVVALLEGDKGNTMRCQFSLDDATAGMKRGGEGQCQLSTGERITAVFAGAS